MNAKDRKGIVGQKAKPCNIDRRTHCPMMSAMLDHDKHVTTAFHFPTGAGSVVYDRGKKHPYLEFSFCPYCGESLTATKVRRWRNKQAQKRKAAA